MKRMFATAAAAILATAVSLTADSSTTISGDYVEARTAEVFTGGCLMNMDGETSGREAVMAWRVNRGSYEGVGLEGLKVVAIVAGDVNLGTHELGGVAPSEISSILFVDERATGAQRDALVSLARSLSKGLVGSADVRASNITFERATDTIRVQAGNARLNVTTKLEHNPSCGALKWFEPLGSLDDATIGVTKMFSFADGALNRRWKQVDQRSAFFGTFNLNQ